MDNVQRKEKTISGIRWSMLSQFIAQFSNLLIGILLTRLLTPDDFGLIAMVTVFTGFLAVFQNFGLGSYLIYKTKVSDVDYNTIFYTHIFLGIFLAFILFISSSLIAFFYKKELLEPLTMVISVSFIIQSFSYIQHTILTKKMDFRSIFFVNTVSIVVSGIVAIIMAYKGYGVWSIAAKIIILSLLKTIILWFISSWRPKLIFSKKSLRESLNYSLPIMGNKTIGYFMRNTDNLIIGKFLGSNALGIYSRAYSLMMLPINQISGVLSNVLFPSFSIINDNLDLFRANWIKINRYLAFILFPISVLTILLAKPFTLLVLGDQWREAILVIQILSLASVTQALFYNVGYVFRALGLTKLSFKMNLITSTILVLAIIVGTKYGILGIAISYTIATVLFLPSIAWYLIHKKLIIPIRLIIESVLLYLVVSFLLGAVLFYIIKNFNFDLKYQIIFIPILFLILYWFILKILNDKTFYEIKTTLIKK